MTGLPFAAALLFGQLSLFSPGVPGPDDGKPQSVEEMLRVASARRAAVVARVSGIIDEVFLTLENNPPTSAVSQSARDRLAGEAFTIAVPRLLDGLESPNDRLARSCAIRLRDAAASDAASLPGSVAARLIAILEGAPPRAKTNALVVARVMSLDVVGPAIRALAEKSQDGDIRREAIDVLKQWRDPKGIPVFRAALSDADFKTRQAGIDALAALGDRAALELIRPLVADPSHDVRRSAYAALGTLGDASSLETLYSQIDELLKDPGLRQGTDVPTNLATWIVHAIGVIGSPESLERLRAVLPSFPEKVQAVAREACSSIMAKILAARNTDALPLVRPFLEDSQAALRDLAFDVVGALEDKGSIEILKEKLKSGNPAILKKAAEALGLIGDRSVSFRLRPLLRHESSDVRTAAAIALARLKDTSGKPALAKPYEDRLKENPNDIYTRLQLAHAYKQAYLFKDAIDEYREALRRRGPKEEAEIHLEIAACYAALGQIDDGRKHLSQARDRGADVDKALAERADLKPLR